MASCREREASATSITSARCRSLQPQARSYSSRKGRPVTGYRSVAAISEGTCVGRSRSTRGASAPAAGGKFCSAHRRRSRRARAACSSGSAWRASVGASGFAGRIQVPAAFRLGRAGFRDLLGQAAQARHIPRLSAAGSASPACECWSPGRRWWALPRRAGSGRHRRRARQGCDGTRRASYPRDEAVVRTGRRTRVDARCL